MQDLKQLYKDNFLRYASYVILDRAIPSATDGLKPVQRRILWMLKQMDDGKMHKVANVAGQTMALHPHGDKPIIDALVNLANKEFLMDRQGNFGNPLTGDPASAARYIETRLSQMAKETLFNAELTQFSPSYDGRAQEPVCLPAKIPLLLMQGAEGIAVGMSTKILPHNFNELLEAQIAMLQGKSVEIFPDFFSGGLMDCSEYDQGRGKVKLRAKITATDEKTLIISEICFGTTTDSLIRSIDDAAKKGRIKIESINDYTSEKIEIEIRLPRGQYANEVIQQLYAFTDCEVTQHSQITVIKDDMPCEMSVNEFLENHLSLLQGYLKQELLFEKERLLEKMFQKTLEQIFIENRLYKSIEEIAQYEKIHSTIAKSLVPHIHQLSRVPSQEDQERLLAIPLRRISRFDIDKNQQELRDIETRLAEIEKELKNLKRFTTRYLQGLLKKYGALFPRKTKIQAIEALDIKKIAKQKLRVGYDAKRGFLGTKISDEEQIECTNLDKILIIFSNGSYKVLNVPEKLYVHANNLLPIFMGVADKKSVINIIYRDKKSGYPYIKRFIIKQFILDREYHFLEEDQALEYITDSKEVSLELTFKKKAKQKINKLKVEVDEMPIKSVKAKGVRIANKALKTFKVLS